MRDRFDVVILASCGEQTQKLKILRETTSLVVMDTHDNKAVYLEQPRFSFIKRFWELQRLIWGPLITDFTVLYCTGKCDPTLKIVI